MTDVCVCVCVCVCDFWLGVLPNQALTLYTATMLWGSPEVMKSQHRPSDVCMHGPSQIPALAAESPQLIANGVETSRFVN